MSSTPFLVLLILLFEQSISKTYWFTKSENVCDENPFRGFVTAASWGIDTDFPISMEFHYIPLKDVMTDFDSFTWNPFEVLLNDTASRNHHSIIRFYLDYPGISSDYTAVPQFLIDLGLQFHSYSDHDGGKSPFYNDTNLEKALINFINNFGINYDGDKRIGVIQLGLLGFWGEWHTWPHIDWLWTETFANNIMNEWNKSFNKTQLNIRIPSDNVKQYRFGLHDDSFGYDTYDISGSNDWYFYSKLVTYNITNKWKENIMGGEIYPDLQSEIFAPWYSVWQEAQDWYLCVNYTHISYMLNHRAFGGNGFDRNNGEYQNGLNGARSLGYYIYLDYVIINIIGNNQIKMDINLINDGIAPFYYDLSLIIYINNHDADYEYSWNENISFNELEALSSYFIHDIIINFNDDLLKYFQVNDNGYFDIWFNVTFKLYSSMAFDTNPIRLCNEEIDNINNIGTLSVYNAFHLNGTIDSGTTTSTIKPHSTTTSLKSTKNTISHPVDGHHLHCIRVVMLLHVFVLTILV